MKKIILLYLVLCLTNVFSISCFGDEVLPNWLTYRHYTCMAIEYKYQYASRYYLCRNQDQIKEFFDLLENEKKTNMSAYIDPDTYSVINVKFVSDTDEHLGMQIALSGDYAGLAKIENEYHPKIHILSKNLMEVLNKIMTKENAVAFSDTSQPAVIELAKRGIVWGYPDGSFKPDAPVTRAEFISLLMRNDKGFDNYNYAEKYHGNKYHDVPDNAYYASCLYYATEKSIIYGSADGYYYPDENISLQDMYLMFARADQFVYLEDKAVYRTNDNIDGASDYAHGAIESLLAFKLIDGKSDFLKSASRLDVVRLIDAVPQERYADSIYYELDLNKNGFDGYEDLSFRAASIDFFIMKKTLPNEGCGYIVQDPEAFFDIIWKYNYYSNWELTELIDKYAPNIKKYLDSNPDVKNRIADEKGNIYYIPWLVKGQQKGGFFMRTSGRNEKTAQMIMKWYDHYFEDL